MIQTIWKFQLKVTKSQIVEIPTGAQLLTVQIQHNILCLWALVDPKAIQKPYRIEIFETGYLVPPGNRRYLGTFQLQAGDLVYHVFEATV